MRNRLFLLIVGTLAGCSSVTVPDMTYYRLPEPAAVDSSTLPHFSLPIDVEIFAADGLYAEQSIIYSLDAEARALRGYHYQLWSDPPSRMLQRRLISLLRRAELAPQVTDRLPASADALGIDGVILRYDRVQRGAGFAAVVSLQLRVEHGGKVLSERVYAADEAATGPEIGETVQAFGRALDRIYLQFLGDIARLQPESKS